jgi:hypothetical protein
MEGKEKFKVERQGKKAGTAGNRMEPLRVATLISIVLDVPDI